MGTQFFWVYDIAAAAILIGIVFKCWKKGFVSTLLGFVAIFVAFFGALWFSEGLTDIVYENLIEKNIQTEVDNQISTMADGNILTELDKIDTSKILVNGKTLDKINLTADSAGKATLDLSSVDFSDTGISDLDLSLFGLSGDIDYSSIKVGTVQFKQSELENNDLGTLILARTLASTAQNGTIYGTLCEIADNIAKSLPSSLNDFSQSVNSGENTAISDIILSLINVNTDIGSSIIDNLVKPVIIVPLRALIFMLLFGIIIVLLNLIIRATNIINKIPLVGFVNELLGGVLGVVEAFIVLFIICICIQVIISLTGNELIFLNTMTIDQTYAFKHIYNFDFLNFLL